MALPPKQQRFVDEYLIDLNGKRACIRAGYAPRYADRIANQLLEKTRVSEAIEAAIAKRSIRTELTQDWVLRQLKKESQASGEGSSHSARVRALELIGKHLGMFTDPVEAREGVTVRWITKVVNEPSRNGHHPGSGAAPGENKDCSHA